MVLTREVPRAGGELLRTLFLKMAFQGCLSAHQAPPGPPGGLRGPRLVAWGIGHPGFSVECPCPSPLLVGRRQGCFFQSGNKTRTLFNREQIPQPDPPQRGPGASTWGAAGCVATSISG